MWREYAYMLADQVLRVTVEPDGTAHIPPELSGWSPGAPTVGAWVLVGVGQAHADPRAKVRP